MPRAPGTDRRQSHEANPIALRAMQQALAEPIRGSLVIAVRGVSYAETNRRAATAPDRAWGIDQGSPDWPPRVTVRADWDAGSADLELRCDRSHGTLTFIVGRGPDVLVQTNVGGRLKGLPLGQPDARVVIDGTANLGANDSFREEHRRTNDHGPF